MRFWMRRGMHYLDGLKVIHGAMHPRSYLEIGCRFGDSLILADCPSVGVDPTLRINKEVTQPHQLFEMTSDDFFEKEDPKALLNGPVHFGFIDGMHLAEYALRDFINLEAVSAPDGVIAFDDVLPMKATWAGREIVENAWCGDVYKVFRVLKKLRPDLDVAVYDINTKGLGVIYNLDPDNKTLGDAYAKLEPELLGETWTTDDMKALRSEFEVRPVDQLEKDVAAYSRKMAA